MIQVREYGTVGPLVILLHGGPGAPGYMAPVARGLAGDFRVVEPFQRGSGVRRLSVSAHVDDLHEVIQAHRRIERSPPALVGSSWGAMLALAYGARHPGSVAGIGLIGCGTFDEEARARFRATLDSRMDEALRVRLARLDIEIPEPDERLRARAELLFPLYAFDPANSDLEVEGVDAVAHAQSWNDMLRLQREGVYPESFQSISEPVMMFHGKWDPHPGSLIRESLLPFIPHLEYHEWELCGHYPWMERGVADDFFQVLLGWLARVSAETREGKQTGVREIGPEE
jgi:pimeloyl-ACP methyl ester carboxylesterase